MRSHHGGLAALMTTTALFAGFAGQAFAQAVPAGATSSGLDALSEVVVTATKQTETVNRVALSITAETQKSLDQQGVRNVQDLSRVVPGLTIRRSDNNNLQPAVRGIIASGGAPTTGIYLDDTALQKRNGIGATIGNGSPFPPLFDLERVEVLRGPQGTLYGGSSEGGTIRFITPAPSLTQYSVYARAQVSGTEGGDASEEAGVALGGPILQDKLGFRASIYTQHAGGYLDHYNQYTGQQVLKNTNGEDVQVGRLAVTVAPTVDLKITPAIYASYDKLADASPSWLAEPATTTPARYWTSGGAATTAGAANLAYTYPSHTYGPYPFFGPNKAGGAVTSPAITRLFAPSFIVDYDLHALQVRSITSYIQDEQIGTQNLTPSNEVPGLQAGVPFVQELPDFGANFHYINQRHGITEELRLSSAAGSTPFTWVAGVYYSDLKTHSYNYTTENLDQLGLILRGAPSSVIYKAPMLPGNVAQIRDQTIGEKELAAFGQASYALTSKLKLTVGLRASREEMTYQQAVSGPVSGYTVPSLTNGGIAQGGIRETPVTPKFGVEYQLTDRDLLYVTAAKGFRSGGVNLALPVSCAPQLAAAGLSSTPSTYGSDTVWSYEGGAKLRLLNNRAQVNTSVFYIDWKDIQYSVGLPGCVFSYTANAGKAISQGADIQANVRIIQGLSANLSVAYTDAHYAQAIRGPAAGGTVGTLLVDAGNTLPTPPWTAQLGGQYDFELGNRYNGYLRADYQFASGYHSGLGPGTSGYAPDTYNSPETRFVSARAGVTFTNWDLSLFVNNLTNSQDLLTYSGPPSGRYGCSTSACTSYANYSPLFRGVYYRPREVGLTAVFRY
jgi:iron complex outermembrane receptor protein